MDSLSIEQLANAKLLVRVPNWIGDAVMSLPALRGLRRVLPLAEITLAGRPWVMDVFPVQELRCGIIRYDTTREHRGVRGRWRMGSELRAGKFDAALLFQNAFDAAMIARIAGIPIRAGYARHGRGPLLTHSVSVPQPGETPPHETFYYLELLRRLGLIAALPETEENRLRLTDPDRGAAKQHLREVVCRQIPGEAGARAAGAKLLVGIGAGASFGTAKRWPAERFAQFAASLSRDIGAAAVFFGSSEERALVESLLPKAGDAAVSLAGKTSLQDFIRLVPGCDLYVTNDTGTMHVAAALGVPTLAIFGPTDEHGTRPLGPSVKVITGEAECRPCKLRHCPIDHRCMTSISVETLLQAAYESLEKTNPSRGRKEALAF